MVNHGKLVDENEFRHPDLLTAYPVGGDPDELLDFLPSSQFDAWFNFLDFCTAKGLLCQNSTWEGFKIRSQEIIEPLTHHSSNSKVSITPAQAQSARGKRKREAPVSPVTRSRSISSEPTPDSDGKMEMESLRRTYKRTRSEILI